MINLSAFGYEQNLKNPSSLFKNTWKEKSFINGKSVNQFEIDFKKFCNAEDAVAVSSCTSALQLSLLALSVGPGDEVITSPFTWVSTVEVIRQVGAKIVYADIKDDFTLDPVDVRRKITRATKAIILVDLFGLPCDVDKFMNLGPIVIQDAAQSTGAIYKGKRIGALAHLTCFSFYPTKNLSCWGDAGAVTGNKEYIEVIRKLRNHGQEKKFQMSMVGWNARMDSIQAEVLINKLPHLDKWNKRRREIAHRYNDSLQGLVDLPISSKDSIHVYHQYVIMSVHKDRIQSALTHKKIQSRTYYPISLHRTNVYKSTGNYPKADLASLNNLAIPVHQYLTDREIGTIIKTIKEAI